MNNNTSNRSKANNNNNNNLRSSTHTGGAGAASRRGGPVSHLNNNNNSASRATTTNNNNTLGGGGGNHNNSSNTNMNNASSSMLGPLQQAAVARNLENAEMMSNKAKDPYFHAIQYKFRKQRYQEAALPSLQPLSMEYELQEIHEIHEINRGVWEILMDLRANKIQKEIDEIVLSQEINEAKQKLQFLIDEETILTQQVTNLRTNLEEYTQTLSNLDNDLDIVISLWQGQDEVDRDAVATDYSKACLIPLEVIHKFNNRIKELGQEKIGVLTKIKLFRYENH
jgi:regulator of replication initiation timing